MLQEFSKIIISHILVACNLLCRQKQQSGSYCQYNDITNIVRQKNLGNQENNNYCTLLEMIVITEQTGIFIKSLNIASV